MEESSREQEVYFDFDEERRGEVKEPVKVVNIYKKGKAISLSFVAKCDMGSRHKLLKEVPGGRLGMGVVVLVGLFLCPFQLPPLCLLLIYCHF